MGDRIAVMKDGLLQQVGTPREMYDEPANRFVAGFIGSPAMNLATFTIEGTHAKLAGAVVPLSAATLAAVTPEDDGKIVVGFRPEGLRPIDNNSTTGIPIVVDLVEELDQTPTFTLTLQEPVRALLMLAHSRSWCAWLRTRHRLQVRTCA